ncbi:hypothetical protein NA57DRAFT_29885 [Rhizodiscina lignyota]|uniref:Acyltransferase MbtK/IucB-like conserved domain-containing protein n=1 Tax=Rhizodiscina lignyota TaxID=1504668 RepID=A0A9P4MAS9_9PEZI|nr:hypothetical protein NA57DRAFT_29885 [Rhizodiscina lignyota]
MAPSIVHLPNGHNLTVTPVFGGLYFKANDLSTLHNSAFPPGWTIVINSEDDEELDEDRDGAYHASSGTIHGITRHRVIHRYKRPTLNNDHMFISSISNPSNHEFKPATSPTRQIAMMLWASLYWYFHQPEPELQMTTPASAKTAHAGRPKGDWRININKEGIFKGRLLLQKLERMGLISSEESFVGADLDERAGEGWLEMFVSQKSFWQIDARIFLFSLSPTGNSPHPGGTPISSRPNSPSGQGDRASDVATPDSMSQNLRMPDRGPPTQPFRSSMSNLPTYYPPPPPQFIFTKGVRHPVRPKPPQQQETFYTRYIPSVGQYLSFRVPSQSNVPCTHRGPTSTPALIRNVQATVSDSILPTMNNVSFGSTDLEILNKWMNDPRVNYSWGVAGPQSTQEEFLKAALRMKHSFPVIGCWDGKPFGYFEIYWVKEDILGRHLDGVGNYDRGIHCLVGEQEYRGAHRVKVWLSALIHYCWLADNRTEVVMMEPRVDNEKLLRYCQEVGFYKEREISFPHKQSSVLKIRRDAWVAPAI